jgi:hypothetical protein
MSLKAFHIIFILLAISICVFCAVWGFANRVAPGFAYGSAAASIALLIYGVWFLRKAKNIIT